MDFALLPPEINSGRMYAGPGSGPMLAAAAGWDTLAADLQSTATAYGSVISALTGGPWLGPASASMAAAAAPYVAWMRTTAMQAEQAAAQAKAAAAAYETAFAMTVPPQVIAANRSLLMTLVATNFLGQNTPAIAATEAHYAEMWGQDAAAMYGYAGSSAAASTLTPFTPPPPTTDPAGAAGQAATVSQSIVSNGPQLMSALPQALQGLASAPAAADPAQALTSLATLVTLVAIPVAGIDAVVAGFAAPASTFSGSASSASVATAYRGFLINADRDFAQDKGPFTGNGPGAQMLPEWFFSGFGNVGAPSTAASAAPVAAGLGQATSVGALSVPSGWASAAPAFRPVAYALPIAATEAAPGIALSSSGNLLSDMALAGMVGRAVGSTATLGHRERVGAPTRERGKPRPKSPDVAVTGIAAELRELAARVQVLLAKLQDAGIFTDEEVTEQKRRFPGL